MPQISFFFGITIYVQFLDHNPPHIHAIYSGYKAAYRIDTSEMTAGNMTPRADKLIREWIELRRSELIKVWELASKGQQLFPIPPLE